MSRLAKKSIKVPEEVTIRKDGNLLVFKGSRGELRLQINPAIKVTIEDGGILVEEETKSGRAEALTGTTWSLIKNSIQGVTEGFSKILEVEGIGYRAVLEGKELVLFLGYAEPVRLKLPDGITVKIDKSVIGVSGISKDLVGRVAAGIRSLKKPEPYKGKGIRYRGEVVKRKVGKKAGATAGAA